jgi:pyruvate dehydrogenase E1 component beta subunit
VFIFEHALLYPVEGEVPESPEPMDISHAVVRRAGRDVSLITYGGSLPKALDAAERLATDGIDAEVVDLRSLRPCDWETVTASVGRTHRAVVVDEAWRTGSFAAEVATQIMERAFYQLDAPVVRVCSAEVPMPYAKQLEDAALPSPESVARVAREVCGRA